MVWFLPSQVINLKTMNIILIEIMTSNRNKLVILINILESSLVLIPSS